MFSLCVSGGLQAGEGHHLGDAAHVGLVHVGRATQVALALGGLLGEDVALERLTALDGAPRTHAEPLLRAALGLHLGHDCSFYVAPAGDPERLPVLVGLQRLLAVRRGDQTRGTLNSCTELRFLLPLRRQHHDHLAPFELGHVLDHRHVGQLVADALQHAHADVLVGDLAAAVAQRDLALVAVFGDEAAQVAHLDRVVAFVGAGAELDFLDLDDLLLALGFGGLLLLLVLELAVVHQPAHRRVRRGCDLDQIDVQLAGHAQGLHRC